MLSYLKPFDLSSRNSGIWKPSHISIDQSLVENPINNLKKQSHKGGSLEASQYQNKLFVSTPPNKVSPPDAFSEFITRSLLLRGGEEGLLSRFKRYNTIQYNTIQYNTVRDVTLHCITLQTSIHYTYVCVCVERAWACNLTILYNCSRPQACLWR